MAPEDDLGRDDEPSDEEVSAAADLLTSLRGASPEEVSRVMSGGTWTLEDDFRLAQEQWEANPPDERARIEAELERKLRQETHDAEAKTTPREPSAHPRPQAAMIWVVAGGVMLVSLGFLALIAYLLLTSLF